MNDRGNMKHAFIILATKPDVILERLVKNLDYVDNDLYIHIDKKSICTGTVSCKKSRVFFVKRDDLRWGDVSLVEKELEIVEECVKKFDYQYIHLVSGSDLPVKSSKYIHEFCNRHAGKQFIGFSCVDSHEIKIKAGVYHPFPRRFKSNNIVIRLIRFFCVKFQLLSGVTRKNTERIQKGPQWFSITGDFAKVLLSYKEDIVKRYKYTFCPDELFIQTIVMSTDFNNALYDTEDEWNGCMRYVEWNNNILMPINRGNIEKAFLSDAFFARKFYIDDVNILKEYDMLFEKYCR